MAYVIANFGGPRNPREIPEFLIELLTDKDVIRTGWPQWIHNLLFKRIARRRAVKVAQDYAKIGGKSPIHADTEAVAEQLRLRLPGPVLTFHRYLPATHREFLRQIQALAVESVCVFPMFPQFTHATTGSIARWMRSHLPKRITKKLQWVKSYPDHQGFVAAYQNCLRDYLDSQGLRDEEVFLLFSAHGIPQSFLKAKDPYPHECELSVASVLEGFPKAKGLLSYQSKFGPGEWLRPYTSDVCENIQQWSAGRDSVVVVPISFTSDHIETLFEIEYDYLPLIAKNGLKAYRCPALTLRADWIQAIIDLLANAPRNPTEALIR